MATDGQASRLRKRGSLEARLSAAKLMGQGAYW